MAENLDATHLRNGDSILDVAANEVLKNDRIEDITAWCFPSNVTDNGNKQGRRCN